MSATMPGEAEFYCPPGQVTLQVGDLIQLDRGPAVVIERNDSCAKVLRLMGKTKVIVNRFTGEPVEITTNPQPERICMHVDRVMRLKHLTDEECQDFLDHRKPRAVAGGKQPTQAAEEKAEIDMAKRSKKKTVKRAAQQIAEGRAKLSAATRAPRGARAEFIQGLLADGRSDEEIWTETRSKFTYSDRATVASIVERIRKASEQSASA